ncbi:MAG: helix-turn-helix transcriptional regulator [Alkalispirochaeta sp.]
MNVFLRNVATALSEKHMTRVDLARGAGIAVSTINNWYASDRYPRLDHAARIAETLEISLDRLSQTPMSSWDVRFQNLMKQLDEEDTAIVCDIMSVLIEHRASRPSDE